MPQIVKSCPFCGDKSPDVCHTAVWWLRCGDTKCGAEGPTRESEFDAIDAWNSRFTPEE